MQELEIRGLEVEGQVGLVFVNKDLKYVHQRLQMAFVFEKYFRLVADQVRLQEIHLKQSLSF